MTLDDGQVLDGKYRIRGVLGRGGMGVVYVAENVRVRRQVAIKVLRKEATSDGALVRFEREAQAAGQIGNDHIVEVQDLGTTGDGERFMVMEYLEGETLKQRLQRTRLGDAELVWIFGQLLDGLRAAHSAGIVHRDLKPDNVFLQREKAGNRDWVKILDFGISKFSALAGGDSETRAGMVLGTPSYMSPEQARAAEGVDARSDIYSVAVMLFEALTGRVPFVGTTFAEMLFKIVFEPQPHPKSLVRGLDDGICVIVVKGMERDPAQRFQGAAAFHEALRGWLSRRPAALAGAVVVDPTTEPLPPRPPPVAMTQPWPLSPASIPMAVVPTPAPVGETQQSWGKVGGGTAGQASGGRGVGIAVAAFAAVVAAFVGVAFVAMQRPAAPSVAGTAAPPVSIAEPAPLVSATVARVDAAAPAQSAEEPSIDEPPAPAPAARSLTAAAVTATRAAAPVGPPKGSAAPAPRAKGAGKVVTDYGY